MSDLSRAITLVTMCMFKGLFALLCPIFVYQSLNSLDLTRPVIHFVAIGSNTRVHY